MCFTALSALVGLLQRFYRRLTGGQVVRLCSYMWGKQMLLSALMRRCPHWFRDICMCHQDIDGKLSIINHASHTHSLPEEKDGCTWSGTITVMSGLVTHNDVFCPAMTVYPSGLAKAENRSYQCLKDTN